MKYSTGVRKLIGIILDSGHCISVHDGEEWACKRSYDSSEIVSCILSVDECSLRVRNEKTEETLGVFVLVNNGDAEDAIADHSANAFCEEIAELYENAVS